MAGRISYYGGIVKDGLVFDLDAAKLESYPRTGTSWIDISGNRNNGTLLNGPTYNSQNGGSIILDGVNDNIIVPYNTIMDPTNGITLETWINPISITGITFMEIFRKENANARQLFSFQSTGTILSFGTYTTVNGYTELDVSINSTDYVNQWVHIVASYTSGNKSIYRNGVLIGSQSSITGNLVQGIANYYIGSFNNGSEFFNGKISMFKQYNKGLTASEVLQNYNATKLRF